MNEPVTYDKAEWHYGGDFPKDLPNDRAYTHTGMFLGWVVDNNLYSDFFEEETKSETIQQFKNRHITGAILYEEWDGYLGNDMLKEEGNRFAHDYYESGQYFEDYNRVLGGTLPSLFHVEDSWENYEKMKVKLDQRFKEWKKTN